jgi:ZIP family zinc transporter
MQIILISIATFFSTLLGGIFALSLKDRLHLVLGFSAGAVLGVAFFDLLPEAMSLGGKTHSFGQVSAYVALGFAIYLIIDRIFLLRGKKDAQSTELGNVGAGTLTFHSFLDGIGIGLAFKVSPSLGLIVAVAVLAHDFSDGINTVNFVLKNNGEKNTAFRWLLVDAVAPALGVIATLFVTISSELLGLFIALFAGFFLYIGASDLLPESQHAHPMAWTTISTLLGMGFLYVLIQLVSF